MGVDASELPPVEFSPGVFFLQAVENMEKPAATANRKE
jgi:hypothetical protein